MTRTNRAVRGRQRPRGFSIERARIDTFLVKLMAGAELLPQPYDTGYAILPWQDSKLIRILRKGKTVVKQEAVEHKALEPFWVEPPPKGHTYSLKNVGGSVGIFQKLIPDDYPPITGPQPELRIANLVVNTRGQPFYFRVEMAQKIDEWIVGLAYREKVEQDGGMLFDWGAPSSYKMWQRDMIVPVDIVFIDADGRIIHVAPDQQPGSTVPVVPPSPARAVLEVQAGMMNTIGARRGDRVENEIFPKRGKRTKG